jgi:hypothetical protein
MSESFGLVWVTAAIACLMASADSGSAEKASSSPIRVTSSLVSWLPRRANSGM